MWAEHYKPIKILEDGKVTKKFRAHLIGGPGHHTIYNLDMPTQTVIFPVISQGSWTGNPSSWESAAAVYDYEWTSSKGTRHYRYVRTGGVTVSEI